VAPRKEETPIIIIKFKELLKFFISFFHSARLIMI
jgi:hypothetical protein